MTATSTTKLISNAAIRRAWMDFSLTGEQAAAQAGLSRVNLWLRARAMGLPPRGKGGRPFVFTEPEFSEMWRAGVSVADIARHFGGAASAVGQAARRRGLPPRQTGRRPIGLEQHRARLADEALAARMRAVARQEAQAMRLAEMVDHPSSKAGNPQRFIGAPENTAKAE